MSVSAATVNPAPELLVEVAGQQLTAKAPQTGAWDDFRVVNLGRIEIAQPGEQVVNVRPKDAAAWKAINLRWVKFTRAE